MLYYNSWLLEDLNYIDNVLINHEIKNKNKIIS